MIESRLEIFRDGEWRTLELDNKNSIKYNKVINRIGDINSREIGHSNTFTLPPTKVNLTSLNINVFNHKRLAKSLNAKYPARYFVEEQILQNGFLIINNTINNDIKVNFIDESLGIIDEWGSTTFKELLRSLSSNIPTDYVSAITEMKEYFIDKNNVLSPLSQVGSRGYNLALFPNNLNCIGDDFQVDVNGDRINNTFNPYQSRPVFNAKAIFDLAVEAYGFNPIYDESVNWANVEKTYVVSKDLSKNYKEEASSSIYSIISGDPDLILRSSISGGSTFDVESALIYPMVRSFVPNDISNWIDPDSGYSNSYLGTNCVFKPDLNTSTLGSILFRVSSPNSIIPGQVFACWENLNASGDVIFSNMAISDIENISMGVITFTVSKSQLNFAPSGAGELIGVFATVLESGVSTASSEVSSVQVTEAFLPIDAISYDENGQYIDEAVDLTYAAPNESIKKLLKGLMQKDGILMNVDVKSKEITFFNYTKYQKNIKEGIFNDWSNYLRKYSDYKYNTNFGNSYGRINEIALTDAYSGNTAIIRLDNQDSDSKYKDKAENFVNIFKDVESVKIISNSQAPYLEYENQGLGLVEFNRIIGPLNQTNANNIIQGNISALPALSNVNYINAPSGIISWYSLVDLSVRATPKFLIPVDVIKNLDLSIPVYIEDLGGYYIIEEVAEYINSSTLVNVKLIKIIDGAEFNDDFNNDFNT